MYKIKEPPVLHGRFPALVKDIYFVYICLSSVGDTPAYFLNCR